MEEANARPVGGTHERESAADQRQRDADRREAALDAREEIVRAQEVASAERRREEQSIIDEAVARDGQADARDDKADDRDRTASLESFLHDADLSSGAKARRAAGLDRSDSKDDRISAAVDRSRLTGGGHPPATVEDEPTGG